MRDQYQLFFSLISKGLLHCTIVDCGCALVWIVLVTLDGAQGWMGFFNWPHFFFNYYPF